MDRKSLAQLPLPTLVIIIGAALAAISAAGGVQYKEAALAPLDTNGRLFLGFLALALCGTGFFFGRQAIFGGKGRLTLIFNEILGDGADNKRYDFKDLSTVDALLDDIYRTRLQGAVRPHSYSVEWILATKGGEKLYDIGSEWATRLGREPSPGQRVPIDNRLVRELQWFRPGSELRVQKPEESSAPGPAESYEVQITSPQGTVMATVEDGRRYFPIGGKLKSLPPDTELWVFVKDISQPRWWPHGPAAVTDGTWNISRLHCGWGQEVKLQACVVGKSGQALVHYYRLAWRQMDQLKRDIKKEFPSANIDGFQAPAIAELSTDITSFDDKTVTVI